MSYLNEKKVSNKLTSGRLWLTAICGLSFLVFVITICTILYTKRDTFTGSELSSITNIILLIISNVMTFYFTKNRDDMNSEKKDNAAFISKTIETGKIE